VFAPVEISTELGRVFDLANNILARREQREQNYWANLQDDLEALRVIVSQLDALYVELLQDIQWSDADGTEIDRDALLREVDDFIYQDRLTQLLITLQARIEAQSHSRTFMRPTRRQLVSALRGLDFSVTSYLEHLEILKSDSPMHDSQGAPLPTLADVRTALRTGETELPLRVLCEEAIRNRRLDLVHSINSLVGSATGSIARIRR
jgi:hypothetical protein